VQSPSRKFITIGFILLSCCASHLSSAICSDESSSIKADNDVELEVTSPSNFKPDLDWLNSIRSAEQRLFDLYKRGISCREDLSCAVSFNVDNGHFNNIHLAKSSGNQSVDTFAQATVQGLENGKILS